MKFTNQERRKYREMTRRFIIYGELLFFILRLIDPAASLLDRQIVLVLLTTAYVAIEVIGDKYGQ